MNAIDTNIWIYCHDIRDRSKQARAQQLVASVGSLVLLWQVGCEFIAAARKLETTGFRLDDAWDALADMQQMAEEVIVPRPESWLQCRTLQQKYSLQFWDALLIAGCLEARVSTLYSEDMSPGNVAGLKVINPFTNP